MIRIIIISAIIILVASFNAFASVRVYLIAGQSNAAGMALSSELTDSEATIPANVELWVNVSGISGNHRLLSSYRDLPKFGPEVKLIKLLAAHYPNERLIVIKIAKGGTNMGHWIAGGAMHTLFFNTIGAVLQGESPKFQRLFWMQGCADSVTDYRDDLYEARTVSFFADVRTLDSNMLVCMGLVNPPYPYVYKVSNAQLRIGKSDPYTRLVTTQGLSKFSDGVHYDRAGVLELGRRMFQKAIGN
ncbi:MAG: sialate O-acetylesterase [Smithella sp.]|jgi:hypothetical protein